MANEASSSDDEITLPNDTLLMLNEFLLEQQQQANNKERSEIPEENWQLSQFWYSEETAQRLVDECLMALGDDNDRKNIVCISCPTLVPYFLKQERVRNGQITITLFEYDTRFESRYSSMFVPYDYRSPLNVPAQMLHSFDFVIADPPFISEECLVKMAQTIRLLSKPDGKTKIIICTGSVVNELAHRLLDVNETNFRPQHANNLANDFSSYSNYTPLTL